MKNRCLDNIDVNFYSVLKESYYPLVQIPPSPQCEVCVVVPVRNEEKLLEGCLKSLTDQVDLEGRALDLNRYEVIVLANNCSDDSVAIAQRYSLQHPNFRLHIIERILPPTEAYIGRVRQILMDEAYHRLASLGLAGLVSKNGIIASTDGDSQVSPTWIAATLLEISRGVDAVGGRIIADSVSCNALEPRVKMRYLQGDDYHQLKIELESFLDPNPYDCFPRHAQHYGASLAVTAKMYRQAGGMTAVRTPEDVEFYRELLRVGAKFRHSPLVQVTTSARQNMRTEGGFAAQLNEWAMMCEQNQSFLVESADAIDTRLNVRRQLRNVWHRVSNGYQYTAKDIIAYASRLAVDSQWLWIELTQHQSFELLFEHIEAHQQQDEIWQHLYPLVSLDQAIADLNTRLQELRAQQRSVEPEFQSNSTLSYAGYGDCCL